MRLKQLLLKNNECYIRGEKITPKGIMVHSTAANNPYLKRYVGPNDGELGVNKYNNHWNQYRPDGRQVCVHAFIGKLENGDIATYQTLPWDYKGWHSGRGTKGSANDLGYIGFEICEDGLTDKDYFNKVYMEAVELCVHLCKLYNLTEKDIICHSEGYKQGIASNHSDVMHWFPKHGKSMDTFRADVKELLNKEEEKKAEQKKETGVWYRVRKTWSDSKSQLNAFHDLNNAKRCVDENPGYSVFDESGNIVYPNYIMTPYLVEVSIPDLNIRKGPGTNYDKVGKYTGKGVFTIVEESDGKGAKKWGKLKSNVGWISLDFVTKL